MALIVRNVQLGLDESEEALPGKLAEQLGVSRDALARYRILRKSLDARRKDELHFEYTAEVEIPDFETQLEAAGVPRYQPDRFDWPEPGHEPLARRPVIVGAGPAGLFAAYMLAAHGYRPLVLERGKEVKDRVADVRSFDSGGPLDPESNYLFGEGGAGTFSDGKLTSRGSGPDVHRVLEILTECHGKPSILYEQRPHLGSNRLPLVVRTLRRKIEQLGGEVQFSCRLEDLEIQDGSLTAVHTSSGRFAADVVVLAIGHSARDTYQMLMAQGVPLEQKAFQLGVRIEQPQSRINSVRHGVFADHPALGAADYSLVAHTTGRDLFTFCMCAGGYVMPSVSDPGYFCTNGMSESRHDSPYANSGLVVTVQISDMPSKHPLAGIHYQQHVERRAFLIGERDYKVPIQWARDFLKGRASQGKLPSSYPRGQVATHLGEILPPSITATLVEGLPIMDRRMRGEFLRDATLVAPESRGSSPVRIPRDDSTKESIGLKGLYPCGEGAGYAGGIVSAAVDGLRTARSIVYRFARPLG